MSPDDEQINDSEDNHNEPTEQSTVWLSQQEAMTEELKSVLNQDETMNAPIDNTEDDDLSSEEDPFEKLQKVFEKPPGTDRPVFERAYRDMDDNTDEDDVNNEPSNIENNNFHIDKDTTAFSLYVSEDWLDDEEDAILRAKFEGKLPVAENELATSIVTRAKR